MGKRGISKNTGLQREISKSHEKPFSYTVAGEEGTVPDHHETAWQRYVIGLSDHQAVQQ